MSKGTRAAIYARFSSHNQRSESIEIQVEKSREYCDGKGLDVVRVYSDYAQTGRDVKRIEFQRMMEDARLGIFDYVVIYKVTRIMRNRDEMALARIKLRKCGVEILYAGESLGEGSTRVLNLGMLEVLAEWESAIDSERIRDGIQKNAERGMANGRTHYGWDIVEGYYQINEHEAAVIRRMKNMLCSGSTVAEITRALKGERGKRGKPLSHNTITKLLKREQNCGVYDYAGVRIEGGMPALWSREEQDMLNSILANNGRKHSKTATGDDYPLSGKLWCPECEQYYTGTSGTSKTGRVYHYYKCKKCRRSFRRDAIEDAVLDSVIETVKSPIVRQRIIDAMTIYNNETDDGEELESKRIEKEIRRIDTSFERIWEAIEDGIAPPGGKERIDMLREQREALEEDLRQAKSREGAPLSEEAITAFIDNLAQEPDTGAVIDAFVKAVSVEGDRLMIYLAVDSWGDDFRPQKKTNPEKGSSNVLMVEPKKIFANSTIAANGREIKVSRNWFCIITLISPKKN